MRAFFRDLLPAVHRESSIFEKHPIPTNMHGYGNMILLFAVQQTLLRERRNFWSLQKMPCLIKEDSGIDCDPKEKKNIIFSPSFKKVLDGVFYFCSPKIFFRTLIFGFC